MIKTYLENSLDPFSGDEAAVDAFFDGSTHANGPEVIEIKVTHEATRSGISGRGNCTGSQIR